MRPVLIVVLLPSRDYCSGVRQCREEPFVKAFVPKAAVEAFDKSILCRLARRDIVPADAGLLSPFEYRYRGQLGAVVGDDRGGRPRRPIMTSNSRATRTPDREVSATSPRHSRVKSSTTARTRNRRPSVNASLTKSRLQRSFGRSGRTIGRRVPKARLRPPRRRTCSLSSRYSRRSFFWFRAMPCRSSMRWMRR